MSAYVDSALIVKLYVPEVNSAAVSRLITQYAPPLPLIALQELEVRNALRLKAARAEISASALATAVRDFERDIASGSFDRKTPNWLDLFADAEWMSSTHAAATLCRSLDVLHVAAARLLKVTDILTADMRQQRLAGLIGLNVKMP